MAWRPYGRATIRAVPSKVGALRLSGTVQNWVRLTMARGFKLKIRGPKKSGIVISLVI